MSYDYDTIMEKISRPKPRTIYFLDLDTFKIRSEEINISDIDYNHRQCFGSVYFSLHDGKDCILEFTVDDMVVIVNEYITAKIHNFGKRGIHNRQEKFKEVGKNIQGFDCSKIGNGDFEMSFSRNLHFKFHERMFTPSEGVYRGNGRISFHLTYDHNANEHSNTIWDLEFYEYTKEGGGDTTKAARNL